MRLHRSQELKEMLPEGVLSIAIRADFWQPQKNDRKAELIKYFSLLCTRCRGKSPVEAKSKTTKTQIECSERAQN